MPKREIGMLVAFVLVVIGTIGLLINDFIFHWGRTTTLTFAAVSAIGLATLAFANWGMKKR